MFHQHRHLKQIQQRTTVTSSSKPNTMTTASVRTQTDIKTPGPTTASLSANIAQTPTTTTTKSTVFYNSNICSNGLPDTKKDDNNYRIGTLNLSESSCESENDEL